MPQLGPRGGPDILLRGQTCRSRGSVLRSRELAPTASGWPQRSAWSKPNLMSAITVAFIQVCWRDMTTHTR
jgi:hypothetical protein